MNVLVLFFCFFSALCGGITAKVSIYAGAEGGTGSINCHPSQSGNIKFFCKNECEAEDVLIKTDDVKAQSGRYSIKYKEDSSFEHGILTVTITNLTKSDSGRYRCGSGNALVPDSYNDFEVTVSDDLQDINSGFIPTSTEGEEVSFACTDTVYGQHKFFCRDECKTQEDILIETDGNIAHTGRYSIQYDATTLYGLYVTIKQATKSDTGRYRCGYGRALAPDSYRNLQIVVIEGPQESLEQKLTNQPTATSHVSHPGYFWPLIGCGFVVGVLLLVVFLLLHLVWRTRRSVPSNSGDLFPIIYKKFAHGSTCETSINENSKD